MANYKFSLKQRILLVGILLLSFSDNQHINGSDSINLNLTVDTLFNEHMAFEKVYGELTIGDTLLYNEIIQERTREKYSALFSYVVFQEVSFGIRQLNLLIQNLIFDGFENPDKYVDNYIIHEKSNQKEEYFESDDESLEMLFNSNYLVSFIHEDFEKKGGGARMFGQRFGFIFDVETGKQMLPKDIFDSCKLDSVRRIIKERIVEMFESDEDFTKEVLKTIIPITNNIAITKSKMIFIYANSLFSFLTDDIILEISLNELKPYLAANMILFTQLR
ncbi:MAG: hypothetical protein IPF46_07025 [Saprospiraceae bacterium]|nr:hypothetical protein [Candidatus Vicinibacter affinis]